MSEFYLVFGQCTYKILSINCKSQLCSIDICSTAAEKHWYASACECWQFHLKKYLFGSKKFQSWPPYSFAIMCKNCSDKMHYYSLLIIEGSNRVAHVMFLNNFLWTASWINSKINGAVLLQFEQISRIPATSEWLILFSPNEFVCVFHCSKIWST